MAIYFAKDGNFGDATGLVIIDNSLWNEKDLEILDYAGDDDRAQTAQSIQNWIEAGRPDIMDDRSDTFGIYLNLEEMGY